MILCSWLGIHKTRSLMLRFLRQALRLLRISCRAGGGALGVESCGWRADPLGVA